VPAEDDALWVGCEPDLLPPGAACSSGCPPPSNTIVYGQCFGISSDVNLKTSVRRPSSGTPDRSRTSADGGAALGLGPGLALFHVDVVGEGEHALGDDVAQHL